MSQAHEILSPSLGVRQDATGNPIGKALPGWHGCHRLPDAELIGHTCAVLPYDRVFAPSLFEACAQDDGRMWTYLPWGPFEEAEELADTFEAYQNNRDFQTFVVEADGHALGFASFMRYDPPNGIVEVGGVTFSPALQQSTAGTEAMFLMMKHAFDHGYRRYEWKCDQLNGPSNKAALRLGFQFEGVFRNAMVTKGRRRDTAWYSVIVEDWPQVKARLEHWLDPANFDAEGKQAKALSAIPA